MSFLPIQRIAKRGRVAFPIRMGVTTSPLAARSGTTIALGLKIKFHYAHKSDGHAMAS
jgi:hypothetical protein